MTKEIERAAGELLIKASSAQGTPSARLIEEVERSHPNLSGDVVRFAYWRLVGEGKLEQTGSGVRRTNKAQF